MQFDNRIIAACHKKHTIAPFAISYSVSASGMPLKIKTTRQAGGSYSGAEEPIFAGCRDIAGLKLMPSRNSAGTVLLPVDQMTDGFDGIIQLGMTGINNHIVVDRIFYVFMEVFLDEGATVRFGFEDSAFGIL